jgi:hypothetical protein
MPNTFVRLDVPTLDGAGTPFITGHLGRSKTIVFSGAVLGRYMVEGSNDGGVTWDILVDDSGQQALYTARSPGVRTFDSIVERVRVRSAGNAQLASPPTIALGAPTALGTAVFGVLDVPPGPGVGAVFDLGTAAAAFKTFILRGSVPPGSRYSILGSIDGVRFDEVMLFTSDQQGARPVEFLCRYLQVQRGGGGATPVISFGSEGSVESGQGTNALSLADDAEIATGASDVEEVLRQYHVPLARLAPSSLRLTFAGESRGNENERHVTYRVRAGGLPDAVDGTALLTVPDAGSGDHTLTADSPAFSRPAEPSTLIKLTGQGDGTRAAVLRNFVLLFHADGT